MHQYPIPQPGSTYNRQTITSKSHGKLSDGEMTTSIRSNLSKTIRITCKDKSERKGFSLPATLLNKSTRKLSLSILSRVMQQNGYHMIVCGYSAGQILHHLESGPFGLFIHS
jgi:hypothetical protein